MNLLGLHHITAIASDPKIHRNFYTRVLGLRFVKKSVNQDDPGTYHLYYGDNLGSPGTALTFFPWQGLRRGRPGVGQALATAFSIPPRRAAVLARAPWSAQGQHDPHCYSFW